MPTVRYPGTYVKEMPSNVHAISGVKTSTTAFLSRAKMGPTTATPIYSYSEFTRTFGGRWEESMMSYAVQHYFLNGGKVAVIVRISRKAKTINFVDSKGRALFKSANPGSWATNLEIMVSHRTGRAKDRFDLAIKLGDTGEEFTDLSVRKRDPRYAGKILEQESQFLRINATDRPFVKPAAGSLRARTRANLDGEPPKAKDLLGNKARKTGIYALDDVDSFNMLCIPVDALDDSDVYSKVVPKALEYCKSRRAMLLLDPPKAWKTSQDAKGGIKEIPRHENGAIFFPRLTSGSGKTLVFPPCGSVAGLIAQADINRGVWKSPAGTLTLQGVSGLETSLTDVDMQRLNNMGVNCLKKLQTGIVLWGARTLAASASEWKYLVVRRMALFIEESINRGTKWAVFEPNDEPLWIRIRTDVSNFLHGLFVQGAFQGRTPSEAYFVKCGRETMTQHDIDSGNLNIIVGFAPIKPAEFVILTIGQWRDDDD